MYEARWDNSSSENALCATIALVAMVTNFWEVCDSDQSQKLDRIYTNAWRLMQSNNCPMWTLDIYLCLQHGCIRDITYRPDCNGGIGNVEALRCMILRIQVKVKLRELGFDAMKDPFYVGIGIWQSWICLYDENCWINMMNYLNHA